MSIYDNHIQAFVNIIESQSHVFSNQDWSELQQISTNLPENKEQMVEVIENWLQPESRQQLLQAYENRLSNASYNIDLDINLGIGGSKSTTPPNQPSQSSKELLDNAIKKNSPLSDNTKNNQNT